MNRTASSWKRSRFFPHRHRTRRHPPRRIRTPPSCGGRHPACLRGRHLAARTPAQSCEPCVKVRVPSAGRDARVCGRRDARHYGRRAAAGFRFQATYAWSENPVNNCALARVKSRIVKASTPNDSKKRKARWRRQVPRRLGCRACPLRAFSGACLDPTLKSGRCGDWVWFVLRGHKQFRRRWVKPNDPGSWKQRRWRARLSAASRRYSRSLTQKQQEACIAAGAKRRSHPRLSQSGPLTGQQYSVGKECAAHAEKELRNVTIIRTKVLQRHGLAKTHSSQVLQHQGIARGTWEHRRSIARPSREHHQRDKGLGRKDEGRRKNVECTRRRKNGALRVRQERTTTLSTGVRYRSVAWVRPQPGASSLRDSPSPAGRASMPDRRINATSRRPACLHPGS